MLKMPSHLSQPPVSFFDPGTVTTWTLSGPCIYRQGEDDPAPVLVRVMPFWRASIVFHRLHGFCNRRQCEKEWRFFHDLTEPLRKHLLGFDPRLSWHGSWGWGFDPEGCVLKTVS